MKIKRYTLTILFLGFLVSPCVFAANPDFPELEGWISREKARVLLELKSLSAAENQTTASARSLAEDLGASAPVYVPFDHHDKVGVVLQREYLLARPEELPKWVGTTGLGPCIGLVVIAKKEGKVVSVAVAHVDSMTKVEESRGFFWQSKYKEKGDAVEVYLLASAGDLPTVKKIVAQLALNPHPSTKYFADIRGPHSFAVNTQTGEISVDIRKEDLNWTQQEDNDLAVFAQGAAFPTALMPSRLQLEINTRRWQEQESKPEQE